MDGAGVEEEQAPEAPELKDKKEDTLLNIEHFTVDADAVGGHGTGSSVLSAFRSTALVEEDGRYCNLQATGSTSQGSEALDSQLDLASMCGRLPNFLSDVKAVLPLSGVETAQESTSQSGLHEQCESYYSDGIEKEAQKKKSNGRSGMCAEKASSEIPRDLSRQHVFGPATHRSSQCTSANTAAQQSYKVSSVLESGISHDGAKGRKELLENPEILPSVRKKSRTFYSAEQLEELEKMFQEDHYPDNEKRKEIAAVVGVTPQRIMVWFQNRRAKWRKSEKLGVKVNKKCPASSALSVPFGSDNYGAPLLPMPSLPGIAHDQSSMLSIDTTAGNYSRLLSGHPAPLASSSVSSAAGMVASCETVPTKVLPQLNFSSSTMECFPSLPSPPPIRRASLSLRLSFSPQNHIVPLMLDTPNSECSLSSQENGSREAFAYSIQNQSSSSPVSCNYPEHLESAGNLETMYCQYSSQGGIYQLPQYPQQHQLSQFYHLPGHLPSNVPSSVHFSPPTPTEPHTAFLALPSNSGVVTYGAAGPTQGYMQNHMGDQLLLQQPSGNSEATTAYQAVPWNDFYMRGSPFSNQLRSQIPFSSTAGGQYFTEQVSYTQPPCLPSSPYLPQVPNGTMLTSVPHTGKQKEVTPPDQSSYQNLQTEPALTSPAKRQEVESSSKKGETVVDVKEETND
ncbi:homeobox protein NOBOX isoform A [Patagioenas fasciata monilis]|uniref:Homeobox protein NOBOX isoform A n=1 Tax=Patagioenas fasciata monilis TaxID=372326 RepID=A0A1V4K889_PATFA|nr:homeobox protein NOBOX isoform A [Patagioenas fasciata monilis]